MNLVVNEIFHSLQGEGGRSGEASVFIRLAGCNLRCDFCDTDFETGTKMSREEILNRIAGYPSRWIIWTGGEPTLQLNDEILLFFKGNGYRQAIETNGTKPLSSLLDYVTCSPKGNYEDVRKLNPMVDEVRLPVRAGNSLPPIEKLPVASVYYASPVFSENSRETVDNIAWCVDWVKHHPAWRLSLQIHKLIGIA